MGKMSGGVEFWVVTGVGVWAHRTEPEVAAGWDEEREGSGAGSAWVCREQKLLNEQHEKFPLLCCQELLLAVWKVCAPPPGKENSTYRVAAQINEPIKVLSSPEQWLLMRCTLSATWHM